MTYLVYAFIHKIQNFHHYFTFYYVVYSIKGLVKWSPSILETILEAPLGISLCTGIRLNIWTRIATQIVIHISVYKQNVEMHQHVLWYFTVKPILTWQSGTHDNGFAVRENVFRKFRASAYRPTAYPYERKVWEKRKTCHFGQEYGSNLTLHISTGTIGRKEKNAENTVYWRHFVPNIPQYHTAKFLIKSF